MLAIDKTKELDKLLKQIVSDQKYFCITMGKQK